MNNIYIFKYKGPFFKLILWINKSYSFKQKFPFKQNVTQKTHFIKSAIAFDKTKYILFKINSKSLVKKIWIFCCFLWHHHPVKMFILFEKKICIYFSSVFLTILLKTYYSNKIIISNHKIYLLAHILKKNC